eukprot:CAMPEP_0204171216 /NCGR_PEP_ID=MMETSP0361-20130328/43041_1 /ASSEMBLY_ACC=CAM_ASM_000343 /TAXON_ID=268821 /ORGANISM="Scrippsiella Hangoei, Strain SHTV-5" /LENGTH=59 /DNA_ID=CAMNT_0051129063 /DNA_START=1 /DNA_END=183 /DNA_ORIENTATION=+
MLWDIRIHLALPNTNPPLLPTSRQAYESDENVSIDPLPHLLELLQGVSAAPSRSESTSE